MKTAWLSLTRCDKNIQMKSIEKIKIPTAISKSIKAFRVYNFSSKKGFKKIETDEIISYLEVYVAGNSLTEVADHFNVPLHRVAGAIDVTRQTNFFKAMSRYNRVRIKVGEKPLSFNTLSRKLNNAFAKETSQA